MPPILFQDVFTEQEYNAIYNIINKKIKNNIDAGVDKYKGFFRVATNGFMVYTDETFPLLVNHRLRKKIQELTGVEVKRIGMHFSRYVAHNGLVPKLLPHIDKHSRTANLTMTVQLKSTLEWDIYVNEDRYELKNNTGLMFCSNWQHHWRPDKEFLPEDYYDTVLILINQDTNLEDLLPDHHFEDFTQYAKLTEEFQDILHNSKEASDKLEITPCTNPDCAIPDCFNNNCEMNDYHRSSSYAEFHHGDITRRGESSNN